MLGQAHHFRRYAPEQIPYAIDRYTNEAERIYGVIDKRVGDVPHLPVEYSIAEIATYPRLKLHKLQGQRLEDFPNLKRWYEAIEARPAVQKGMAVMAGALCCNRTTRKPSRFSLAPNSTNAVDSVVGVKRCKTTTF